MTTIEELLKRDLKKDPILLLSKRLNKYRKSSIPPEKSAKVKNLLTNTNLNEAIEKERITKP
ncbi:MAG: hypothetical protein WAT46_15900 [Saprospiraceae bacterium]|jgi:hypothetical protein|nr:hypothetical protein [Saprospiraceae bacterium]